MPFIGNLPLIFSIPSGVSIVWIKRGANKEPDIMVICQVPAIIHPGAWAEAKHNGA
ncbi:hypothetical protein GCM10007140_23010 [Priestia taiwanensis]|uniref:Uncharacterized protein n=1 Tax=Priestia taiwanensis TaxID=1347902 RepID=A0A917AT15_9BACI|nr:hypothetical protein GCM10007140_23010 [Priestia taiwanensis]